MTKAEDDLVLEALRRGRWWAAHQLAIQLRLPRPLVDLALRRLKRRGLAEAGGQLWQATALGRGAPSHD